MFGTVTSFDVHILLCVCVALVVIPTPMMVSGAYTEYLGQTIFATAAIPTDGCDCTGCSVDGGSGQCVVVYRAASLAADIAAAGAACDQESLCGALTCNDISELCYLRYLPIDPTPTVQANYHSYVKPAAVNGDPQFAGFQGQNFQFHGEPDVSFNLISTPHLQLNAHFVYLTSSAPCTYNDTMCFQHSGTYLDDLGFMLGNSGVRVRAVAGTHSRGAQLWVNDVEIHAHVHAHGITFPTNNATDADQQMVTIKFNNKNVIMLRTTQFHIEIQNSENFFNLQVSLLDSKLMALGSKRVSIHEHQLCQRNGHRHAAGSHASHHHDAVEAALDTAYGLVSAHVHCHGLIGQTWRNAVICSQQWIGAQTDYQTSDLWASDYYYNNYQPQNMEN